MKNLVVLHLESLSRQRLAAFAPVLPHTRRLLQEAVVFDNFFASATSTLMVTGYLFHGNDFEYDTSSAFAGMRPAGNNPSFFSILQERGYHANLICLNGYEHVRPIELRSWAGGLPPIWGTHDFPSLFARFDELTDAPPFAIHVWNLITHIEHSLAVSPHASGLTDQFRRAWAIADDAIGHLRAVLERKGLLENTTIVLNGDHGDDPWTHGFRGGLTHGTEPYTDIVWTPFAIRDPEQRRATVDGLARTIDIAPDVPRTAGRRRQAPVSAFRHRPLPRRGPNSRIRRTSRPTSRTIRGRASPRRFRSPTGTTRCSRARAASSSMRTVSIPGNHCNLLHLFELDKTGRPVLVSQPGRRRALQGGVAGQSDVGRRARQRFPASQACSRGARGREAGLHRRARCRPPACA
jgi:hypothetical protein